MLNKEVIRLLDYTVVMAVNRGSEWGKWDLHVHTPLSFESQFEISQAERDNLTPIPELTDIDTPDRFDPLLWTKYINELETVEDIDCIGITDYFSLEGYDIVKHVRDHGYLDNFEKVFPNIEFRLDTITGEDNRINLHVVFSDEVSIDDIRQEFLTNLTLRLDHGEEYSLRPSNLKKFGAQAKEYHDHASGLSDYAAGCTFAWIEFKNILQQLDNSRSLFQGNYLTILSGAEWSEIEWFSQDAEIRRQLLADSHALFSGNPRDRKWASGKGDITEDKFEDEFGSLKPVLHGSDAHSFDRLCQPDENRYCWIKANHSFAGLKQIVFEPSERLHVGATEPDGFTQIQTIDSLQIQNGEVNSDLEIEDDYIPFNSNLVSIIGNQGAGKTALLDLVANCFYSRTEEETDDDNSFICRIENDSPNITTEISFAGEDIEPFSKEVLEPDTVDGPDISYVPQGKIVEYCQKGNKLHERIRTLVTESVEKEVPDLVAKLKDLKEETEELAKKMRSVNADLHEINPQKVKSDLTEEKEKFSRIKTLLKNKQEEISQFKEEHQEPLEETEAEELQSELDKLIEERDDIEDLIDNISSAETYLGQVRQFNELIQNIQNQKSAINLETSIKKIELRDQQDSLDDLQEEAESAQRELTEEISGIRSELDELDEVDEDLSALIDEKRQIKDRKVSTEERIDELNETLKSVDKLANKRISLFVSYVDSFFDSKEAYGEIATAFSEGESTVLNEIRFEPHIEVTGDRIREFVDILDNRKVNREEIKPYIEKLEPIISGSRPDDLEGEIEEYISDIEEFRDTMLDSRDPIDFDSLLYGDCLELSEEIYYQETPMGQLSRGQKGTVLLRIYLAKGENPLIIDSPEENLDNQYVFEELIGAVRDAKKDRQIFLATHDANLVVNTDSEQIVIPEFDHGKITFEGGALENQNVRDKAKGILEGGDEAFKLREEKYDLTPS